MGQKSIILVSSFIHIQLVIKFKSLKVCDSYLKVLTETSIFLILDKDCDHVSTITRDDS